MGGVASLWFGIGEQARHGPNRRHGNRSRLKHQFVAVLIGEPSPGQRHIGVWYRADVDGIGKGESNTVHLAWHCQLESVTQPPDCFTIWVKPSYPVRRLRQAATYFRLVAATNGRGAVPYAFSSPIDSMDPETGAVLLGPTRFGLTCASFVLALFHSARLPLIDYSTWISDRPGDRKWQEDIVENLVNRADATHIDHVRSEIVPCDFDPKKLRPARRLRLPLPILRVPPPWDERSSRCCAIDQRPAPPLARRRPCEQMKEQKCHPPNLDQGDRTGRTKPQSPSFCASAGGRCIHLGSHSQFITLTMLE